MRRVYLFWDRKGMIIIRGKIRRKTGTCPPISSNTSPISSISIPTSSATSIAALLLTWAFRAHSLSQSSNKPSHPNRVISGLTPSSLYVVRACSLPTRPGSLGLCLKSFCWWRCRWWWWASRSWSAGRGVSTLGWGGDCSGSLRTVGSSDWYRFILKPNLLSCKHNQYSQRHIMGKHNSHISFYAV